MPQKYFVNWNFYGGVLVLGAGTGKNGPGPLVTQLTKTSGVLPVPMTIVPGDLSKEKLEAIT